VPSVRRLLPLPRDIDTPIRSDDAQPADGERHGDGEARLDVEANVAAEARPAPADRPWVMVNMVASVDGASAGPDGRSRSLSGEADRRLFHALRAVADVVLAGAGTVRAENYGAPRGDGKVPRLATVSSSLAFDPDARFFSEPAEPPIVLTTEQALVEGRADPRLAAVAELRAAGQLEVDWPAALRLLRTDYDCRTLMVEGGSTLNTRLVADDLIDEFRLTVAPLVVGGSSHRVVGPGAPAVVRTCTLADLAEEDGFLFFRYVRRRH
jgi:riboflavin-specific deaminase-like protein